MQRPTRWTALLDMLAGDGRVEIDDAAERLGVSPATVRRDLDELASQQLLVRTRGGAVPTQRVLRPAAALQADPAPRREARRSPPPPPSSWSRAASSGSTAAPRRPRWPAPSRCAPTSRDRLGDGTGTPVTVVTNALNIAHELAVRPHVKLVVTGGVVRSQSYELVGPLAMPALERLTLDVAILGVDGISVADGATHQQRDEAAVNELMARRARTVVVVADASKLGRRAFARICPIDRVDIVVTGATGDGTLIADLRAAGVDVITVRAAGRSRSRAPR